MGLDNEIMEILSKSEEIDKERGKKIAETVILRAEQLRGIAASKKQSIVADLHKKQREIADTPAKKSKSKSDVEL